MKNSLKLGGIALFFLLIPATCVSYNLWLGIGSWGPTRQYTAKVVRCWVDTEHKGNSKGSHYMVGTSLGVFEVQNGFSLNVWDADDMYNKFEPGSTVTFLAKGNRCVNMFYQEFPYVIKVLSVSNPL